MVFAVIVADPPNVTDVPLIVAPAFANLACANVPVDMLLAFNAVKLLPLPENTPVFAVIFAAVILPLTPKLVNVPVLVMFGCAFVVTVPAVVVLPDVTAYVALATVPVTLAPVS